MTIRDAVKKYGWVLVPISLIAASFFVGSRHGYNKAIESIDTKTDTVIKVVPVYKDFPDPQKSAISGFVPVPVYKFISDTVTKELAVITHDPTTVYLPREQKYYEEDDGRLRLWVSGFEPRLDRYELDRIEKVVTNTVTVPQPKFVLEIESGFGSMFPQKNVNYFPYIELEASYSVSKRWRIGVSGGCEVPVAGGKATACPYVKIGGRFSILNL